MKGYVFLTPHFFIFALVYPRRAKCFTKKRAFFIILEPSLFCAFFYEGQYREALKLLYNAARYEEVLTAMARALRLPLRAPGASTWHMGWLRVLEIRGVSQRSLCKNFLAEDLCPVLIFLGILVF